MGVAYRNYSKNKNYKVNAHEKVASPLLPLPRPRSFLILRGCPPLHGQLNALRSANGSNPAGSYRDDPFFGIASLGLDCQSVDDRSSFDPVRLYPVLENSGRS